MIAITRRCAFAFAGGALAAAPGAAFAGPGETATKLFEMTYLKSADANPASLARFIELNWFAMDKIAKAQGLMTEYRLLVSPDIDQPWNVLVEVGYPTDGGYADIASAFERIRSAHTRIPVDGKSLRELGRIVETRRVVPGASS